MISRKSWDYKKTFSKRLRVVKNQTLFIHSRSWTWEHSSDEGHLLQPNLSERPKKNLPLLLLQHLVALSTKLSDHKTLEKGFAKHYKF